MSCQHYADETVVFINHGENVNISNKITTDLDATLLWCQGNKLRKPNRLPLAIIENV